MTYNLPQLVNLRRQIIAREKITPKQLEMLTNLNLLPGEPATIRPALAKMIKYIVT